MYAYFSTNTDENKNAPGLTEDITYYITGEPSKLQHQETPMGVSGTPPDSVLEKPEIPTFQATLLENLQENGVS